MLFSNRIDAAPHWSIHVRYTVRKAKKAEIIRTQDREERIKEREQYELWNKAAYSAIPKNGNREIYYSNKEVAEAAFKKANLSPDVYEICEGFFL
jgi:hypothetical protein